MRKATKWLGIVLASAVCVTSVSLLAACDKEPETKEYTVTYYDGNTALREQKVKEGEKATKWTPSKTDYVFVDWFATPNFVHKFDFETAITEDKSAFAQWVSANQSVDTREYYIVGSGTSPILKNSNWGKHIDSTMKMSKADGKNEYSFTTDLNKGDEFQFAIDTDWKNQRGVGYLETMKLADGRVAFSGSSTIGDNPDYRLNIKCELAGNYTFTLSTHPDDDKYETEHSQYTEESKENFNYNPLDKIKWVRNGDVSQEVEVETDFYIKGEHITKWQNVYNASTKMSKNDGVYTLEVYLKANDVFMFISRNTIGTEVSDGTAFIRGNNLDDASKALFDQRPNGDIIAKASGTYTFTYVPAAEPTAAKLSATLDVSKVPAARDFYLDGTYGGGTWGDFMKPANMAAHKFTETEEGSGVYTISGVQLKAGNELVIRSYAAGTTELTWDNGKGNYSYDNLVGGGTDFVKPEGGTNIKTAADGTYDITFDTYSNIITILKQSADNLDIYIKGANVNGWAHNFSKDYVMTISADETKYEYTLTVEDGKAVEFGFAKYPKGGNTGYGDYLGVDAIGTSGDANSDFTPEDGTNFKCSKAGTYKIVYDKESGNIDFYAVTNA